jgi:hypothetical protein
MPYPNMDPVYVVASHLPEMTLTAGQFLEVELKRLEVGKTELAKRLGVNYPTVLEWCQSGKGFDGPTAHNRKNRFSAAKALGLNEEHFEVPNATFLHREKCKKALQEFLSNPLAPSDVTPAELANLEGTFPPLNREPTALFYEAYFYLIRNRLKPAEFERELSENEALQRSIEKKLEKSYAEVEAEREGHAKKKRGRAQKRTPRKKAPHR